MKPGPGQREKHYRIEKALALKLRNASKEKRRELYAGLYDELFRLVPYHPQITARERGAGRSCSVRKEMGMIRRHLGNSDVFVELGAGDCALSREVSKLVSTVIAVDVSREIADQQSSPSNFSLLITNGQDLELEDESADIVYSNQLMEHLHPEDAGELIDEVFRVLKPGGRFICRTPNRLTGPHDISRWFSESAKGLHLREYTSGQLVSILHDAGFRGFEVFSGGKGKFIKVPLDTVVRVEKTLETMPFAARRAIRDFLPVRLLLGINMVAFKLQENDWASHSCEYAPACEVG
jgi:SAM-dependent methyltransferase